MMMIYDDDDDEDDDDNVDLYKLSNRVHVPRCEHKVVRLVLLQHQPHA